MNGLALYEVMARLEVRTFVKIANQNDLEDKRQEVE